MTGAVTILLDKRTMAALRAEAHTEGVDFTTYLGRILNARVADQDAEDERRRIVAARRRETRARGLPPRLPPTQWNAIDAAIERSGVVPDRTGRRG